MGAPGNTNRPLQHDPGARAIVASWRRLTGGSRVRDGARRTLLACSGGVDSSALVLAIGSAVPESIVVGHIVHDLRPIQQAHADRDGAAELAARISLPFVQDSVHVLAEGGNAEATARRLRYQALASLAAASNCTFVATGHEADDQLETVLMRLMRGSGPQGLAGVRSKRKLNAAITLVRPMLGVTRAHCERICNHARWTWREDLTNQDVGRLRAAVRASIVPEMRRLCPGVAQRIGVTAQLMEGASRVVAERATAITSTTDAVTNTITYSRKRLAAEPAVVIGEALRCAAHTVQGGEGRDALTWRVIRPAIDAIRSAGTDPRLFEWRNVVVRVNTHDVSVSKT